MVAHRFIRKLEYGIQISDLAMNSFLITGPNTGICKSQKLSKYMRKEDFNKGTVKPER